MQRLFHAPWLVALVLSVTTAVASAQTLNGTVVRVVDGDTLHIRSGGETVKVRLAYIDAPEHGQAYNRRAKEALAQWCAGQQALVRRVDTDRYGRMVGQVECQHTNVNQMLVRAGLAWVYRKYTPDGHSLYAVEQAARNEHLGLWTDRNPTAPWEWRRQRRSSP